MLPDRVSNPGPLTYESGALPIALRGPASKDVKIGTESNQVPTPDPTARSLYCIVTRNSDYNIFWLFPVNWK